MEATTQTRLGTLADLWADGMIVDSADDYAEPGYSLEGTRGVITGDWNNRTRYDADTQTHTVINDRPERIAAVLERIGFTIEWCDEWTRCDECYRLVRTQADSYSWTPSYVLFNECEVICHDCVREDPLAHEEALTNNPDNADTLGIDWTARGWTVCDESFDSGVHPGMDDNPREISEQIAGDLDYLWILQRAQQFDIRFTYATRPKDYDAA